MVLAVAGALVLSGCSKQAGKPVEDVGGGQNVTRFQLTSVKGTRNGDRLDVAALYGDGAAQIAVQLHFRVTPPTTLELGSWKGLGKEGAVHERSSTFLGGQSGPPSIGGSFDLLGADGQALFRVRIPVQALDRVY
ncbi:hypothetical protein [Paludibaculum fermentans]|uniref:Uncharacterized protein n=1 Tax=Paludibaculum fermentans TaxID=1473598 RepID=A0A7S7SNL5_PALFE|nr:hypothetical protein [Paludibaculum fermentans]QOY90250.1 hypothetical protein IRI77_09935 [Paludibaculum fermentans]